MLVVLVIADSLKVLHNSQWVAGLTNNLVVALIVTILTSSLIWLFRKYIKKWIISIYKEARKADIQNYPSYESADKVIHKEMFNSTNVDILTIMGLSFVNNPQVPGRGKASIIGRLLQNDTRKVRILLLDPRSEHAKQRAKRLKYKTTHCQFGILNSMSDLLEIQTEHEGLEIRMYDANPVWRITVTHSGLFLGFYLNNTRCYDNDFYFISKNKRSLYSSYEEYFNYLWQCAEVVNKDVLVKMKEVINDEE
jgi:hypothetical protein